MKKHIYIVMTIAICLFLASCEDIWNHSIDGNGNFVSESRTISTFEELAVSGDFTVEIDTGSTVSLTIEADENLHNYINTYVSGKRLVIETRDNYRLRSSHNIEIHVTTPIIKNIELDGSGSIYSRGFNTNDMTISLSGSGKIQCNQLSVSQLNADLEGSGNITVDGTMNNVKASIEGSGEYRFSGSSDVADYSISGSGNIHANDLYSNECQVIIAGSGVADVYVNDNLNVIISGSGTVYYEGTPEVSSTITGSGHVIKR